MSRRQSVTLAHLRSGRRPLTSVDQLRISSSPWISFEINPLIDVIDFFSPHFSLIMRARFEELKMDLNTEKVLRDCMMSWPRDVVRVGARA